MSAWFQALFLELSLLSADRYRCVGCHRSMQDKAEAAAPRPSDRAEQAYGQADGDGGGACTGRSLPSPVMTDRVVGLADGSVVRGIRSVVGQPSDDRSCMRREKLGQDGGVLFLRAVAVSAVRL